MACRTFNQYFEIQNHGRGTRNDGFKLKIPQTKLDYAKNGFFSTGVMTYNDLSLVIRKIDDFNFFIVFLTTLIYLNKVPIHFRFDL